MDKLEVKKRVEYIDYLIKNHFYENGFEEIKSIREYIGEDNEFFESRIKLIQLESKIPSSILKVSDNPLQIFTEKQLLYMTFMESREQTLQLKNLNYYVSVFFWLMIIGIISIIVSIIL